MFLYDVIYNLHMYNYILCIYRCVYIYIYLDCFQCYTIFHPSYLSCAWFISLLGVLRILSVVQELEGHALCSREPTLAFV